jgi:hypothetical protein
MNQQLDLFSEYKERLAEIVGPTNASSIINGSLYVVSAGSSDFLQNYFINLRLKKIYSVTQFSQIVLERQTKFIQVYHRSIDRSSRATHLVFLDFAGLQKKIIFSWRFYNVIHTLFNHLEMFCLEGRLKNSLDTCKSSENVLVWK